MDASIFGLIVADVIAEPMNLRKPPKAGGLAMCKSITLAAGGNVSNTGAAMAKLGMKVAAAGLVGDDVFGRAVTERLREAGLDIKHVFQCTGAQTCGTIVAIEPGGERTFFHASGVTPLLDADAFRKCFPLFRQSAWVQVGYFGLLSTLTPVLPELLSELKSVAPGTKIALDTVNPPADFKLLKPILPHLDLFAPSRSEAEALSRETTPKKMVAFFRKHMPRGIIGIKLDKQGCCLDDGQSYVTAPGYKIKLVDSTGAGDSWFGGLLTALRKEMPLDQAGRFANRVAADCCSALGTSAGIKSFEETMARI